MKLRIALPAIAACMLAAAPMASAACGTVRHFSGNGGTNLGTLRLHRDATLAWTNDGDVFQIFSADGVPVNSQAHRGKTVLSAGVHKKFQVNAIGNWRITVTPRCSSPAAQAVYRFAGNGGKNLGTIRITRTSVLSWTDDGGIFQIFTADDVPVNSQGRNGTSVLDAGAMRNVQVNAMGNWTITIRPR